VTALSDDPRGDAPRLLVDFTLRDDVLCLHGELDMASAATLDAALGLVDNVSARSTGLVIDLADLQFIDSIGLTRFVRLHQRLARHGGHLALRNPKPNVRKVLEVTGLADVIAIEP
jgi:anti-sigma B factor antagonist